MCRTVAAGGSVEAGDAFAALDREQVRLMGSREPEEERVTRVTRATDGLDLYLSLKCTQRGGGVSGAGHGCAWAGVGFEWGEVRLTKGN